MNTDFPVTAAWITGMPSSAARIRVIPMNWSDHGVEQ
jgi:hypothetical protein